MKWVRITSIIVLIIIAGWFGVVFINQKWKIEETGQQIRKWQENYNHLANIHNTLVNSYQQLLDDFKKIDSLYGKELKHNTLEYEKIIAGFDTLSVDGHIQLLSKYLSEKDPF